MMGFAPSPKIDVFGTFSWGLGYYSFHQNTLRREATPHGWLCRGPMLRLAASLPATGFRADDALHLRPMKGVGFAAVAPPYAFNFRV